MFALEPTEVIEDEPWRIDARCADSSSALVDLFFSEQLDDILRAKAFCVECPVREPCLEAAIARREPWGVWGGELFANGRCWRRSVVADVRPRCGRPSRCSRSWFPSTSPGIRWRRAPDGHRTWRAGVTIAGALSPRCPASPGPPRSTTSDSETPGSGASCTLTRLGR